MRELIKNIRGFLHRWSWVLISLLVLLSLLLGFAGFRERFAALGEERSSSHIFYLTLQLFTLESGDVEEPVGWMLEVARFLAPFSMASAVVRAFWGILTKEIEAARLVLFRKHVIICGLGNKGLRLVKELHDDHRQTVVIENDRDNEDINRCRELGAIVIIGTANDEWAIRKARVHKASVLYSVTGDDGANIETALLARDINRQRQRAQLKCVVHVVDPDLENWFEHKMSHDQGDDHTHIRFFNVFKNGAKEMLQGTSFLGQPEQSTGNGKKSPHIVIIGAGRLGEAVFQQAIHYWRTQRSDSESKLEVTIVDQIAEEKVDWLQAQFADECEDCLLHTKTMQIQSANYKRGDFLPEKQTEITAAYVCVDDDSLAVRAALTLHEHLDDNQSRIVVRLTEEAGLAALFDDKFSTKTMPDNVHAIGLLELTCRLDVLKKLEEHDNR